MKKRVFKLLFIFLVSFVFIVVSAKELEVCEVSEEYKHWSNLSIEDKSKYIIPPYCKSTSYVKENKRDTNILGRIVLKQATPSLSYYVSKSSSVKDQKMTPLCWAMGATTVLESYLKVKENIEYNYSSGHMNYMESQSFSDLENNKLGTDRTVNDGGSFEIAALYYFNNYGPILEKTVPTITDSNSLESVKANSIIGLPNELDVNNIQFEYRSGNNPCSLEEKKRIKDLVYNNGPVGVSILMDNTYYREYNETLDKKTYTYLYKDKGRDELANHIVTIIGWDDDYAVSNFSDNYYKPENPGVWIVQNSWGTSFGDKGIYYISYEDDLVCKDIFSIRDVDKEIEDNKYIGSNDYMVGTSTFSSTSMRVIEKKTSYEEILEEVGFQVARPTEYEVYYYPGDGYSKNVSLSDMNLIASGSVDYAGFITIRPDKKIIISNDIKKYSIAIVLKVGETPLASQKYVTYGYNDNLEYTNVTKIVKDEFIKGEAFIYDDGKWNDLYDYYPDNANKLRINVFTNNINIKVKDVKVDYSYNDSFEIPLTIEALDEETISDVKLFKDDKEIDVISNIDSDIKLNKGDTKKIVLTKKGLKDFVNGKYQLKIFTSNIEYPYVVDINVLVIESISITNKKDIKLEVGSKLQMNVTYSPSNFNSTDPLISYTSSNSSVATIDKDGLVTALDVGKTIIEATTTNGKKDSYELVVERAIKDILIKEESININVGKTYKIETNIVPSNTTDDKTLKWSSSDNNIATVDSNGVVSAKMVGTTVIKVDTVRGISKSIKVYVNGISLNKNKISLDVNKTFQLSATVVDNSKVSNSVKWSSSNTSVATISSSGLVSAKNPGSTTINAIDSKGRKVSMSVNVTKINASNFSINSIPVYIYNGYLKKPSIVVKYNGKVLKKGIDYNISYSNNRYPGKATVKITVPASSKKYTGSKTVNFIIKPRKVVIKNPSTKSKSITVKWSRQVKVNNYEIYYRVKGTNKWKSIKVKSTNSYKITGLVKGKNYQVKVRSYVMVNNKNYYGSFSNIKTIKCK